MAKLNNKKRNIAFMIKKMYFVGLTIKNQNCPQILEIDDIKFTVSFSMYFGVRWQEPRFFGPDPPEKKPYVPIDIGFVNNLWVPDVYIYHLKTIEVLNIFIPFAGEYNL